MRLKDIFLASFFVISVVGCTQSHPVNAEGSSIQQNKQEAQMKGIRGSGDAFSDASSICEKIKQLHSINRIKDIVIANSNSADDQDVDINNDNIPDKIRYRPTRSYMALVEIRDEIKIGFSPEMPTALYTGADIVQIDGKNYVLHYAHYEPYELTEIGGPALQNADYPYQLKTICKFY